MQTITAANSFDALLACARPTTLAAIVADLTANGPPFGNLRPAYLALEVLWANVGADEAARMIDAERAGITDFAAERRAERMGAQ